MGLGGRGMMSGMRKTRTNTTLLSPPHLGLGKRGSRDPRRRARPCVRVMRALFFILLLSAPLAHLARAARSAPVMNTTLLSPPLAF